MAFSVTTLTKGGTNTDAASYTTASITPTTGRLLVAACVTADVTDALVNLSATCTGNNLTWTAIPGQGYTVNGLVMFYAYADGTQTSGGVTFTDVVTSGTAEGATWIVVECVDAFSVTNTQSFSLSNRTTTADTLTLPALGSLRANPNVVFAFFGARDDGNGTIDFTPEAGWTLHDSRNQTANARTIAIGLVYDADTTDTTAEATVSAVSDRMWGAAFELKLVCTESGSVAVDIAVAGAGFKTRSGSASVAADVAISAAGVRTASRSAAIAATVGLAGSGVRTASGSASVAADVAVAAAGVRAASRSGDVAVGVAVSASGVRTVAGSGAVVAGVSVAAAGTRATFGQADVQAQVAVDATGAKEGVKTGSGAVDVAVSVAAAGTLTKAATGAVSVSVSVSGAGLRTAVGSGAVAAAVSVAATGAVARAGSAAVAVEVAIEAAGAATPVKTGSAAVAVEVAVAASGLPDRQGQAGVQAQVAVVASGSKSTATSADVPVTITIGASSPAEDASPSPDYRVIFRRRGQRKPIRFESESRTVLRLEVLVLRPTVLYPTARPEPPAVIRKVAVRRIETRSRTPFRRRVVVCRMQRISTPASRLWEAEVRRLEELVVAGIVEELIDASV